MPVAEDGGKEEKFDFTDAGEALGYISLDQARVMALQHARDNRDVYGAYADSYDQDLDLIVTADGEHVDLFPSQETETHLKALVWAVGNSGNRLGNVEFIPPLETFVAMLCRVGAL